jgi:hypothetical protein
VSVTNRAYGCRRHTPTPSKAVAQPVAHQPFAPSGPPAAKLQHLGL